MSIKKCFISTFFAAGMALSAQAGEVSISGFLSVGGGYVDEEGMSRNGYNEEDITFDQDSLYGLQVSSNISDKASVTAQVTGEGANGWEAEVSWAYFSYQVTDNFKWRAGRLRVPFYLYSDFISVGYAYPWISPPQEVYSLPFDNISGMDAIWNFSAGSVDGSVQGYYGSADFIANFEGDPASTSRGQWGLTGQLSSGWFTARLAYHTADVSVPIESTPIPGLPPSIDTFGELAATLTALGFADNGSRLLAEDEQFEFTDFALQMDTGTFLAVFETSILDSSDETPIALTKSNYLMLGVRAGDFLFHVTGAQNNDEPADLSSGIPGGVAVPGVGSTDVLIAVLDGIAESQVSDSDSITVGFRWDFTSSAAFKFEVTDLEDNKNDADVRLVRFAVQSVF